MTYDEAENYIYGRGVDDDKGGLLQALHAFEILKGGQLGALPNIRFLFEGQEEVMSADLRCVLDKHCLISFEHLKAVFKHDVRTKGLGNLFFQSLEAAKSKSKVQSKRSSCCKVVGIEILFSGQEEVLSTNVRCVIVGPGNRAAKGKQCVRTKPKMGAGPQGSDFAVLVHLCKRLQGAVITLHTIFLGVGGTICTAHTLDQFKKLGIDPQRSTKNCT
eukprot:1161446-Pelagomonas_calceolata.AAC.3